jgi:selenocysteine lyase/cysteine desulfurase
MTGAVIKYIPLDKDGRLTVENLKKTITAKDENRSCGAYYQRFGLHRSLKRISQGCSPIWSLARSPMVPNRFLI